MNRKVYIFWTVFVAAAIFRLWQSFDVVVPSVGDCVKQNVQGVGNIVSEPERKESGQVFVVSVEQLIVASSTQSCTTGFLLRLKTKLYPRFNFNDTVSFKGKLLQPVNFNSGSDRSFDYKGYLAKDDIYYEMKSAVVAAFNDAAVISALRPSEASGEGGKAGIHGITDEPESGGQTLDPRLRRDDKNMNGGYHQSNSFPSYLQKLFTVILSYLYSLKRTFVNNLEKVLGEPHAALAAGLVVGEKAALGKDLLDDFRTVGLIHIVVLSGYNITIVADAMRRLLSFLPRVWGIGVGGIGIALFGILVGGGATVVRSCLMAGIALFADIIRRDYNVTRALLFVGLLMLIQNPMILLHDPSFQLSFLATLGLILLASPIEKRLSFLPEKFGIRGIVASTIATQIFVSPYILYMMGQVSIIGMVVNILVLPFIPLTMLLVFLTGVGGMLWLPLAQFFGWGSYLLLTYELYMVEYFAQFPFASAHVPAFSFGWVAAFYVGFTAVYWWRGRSRDLSISSNNKTKPNSLASLFREFQKLPKDFLIDKPDIFIETPFIIPNHLEPIISHDVPVTFTRRTLKHLAEKKTVGNRLFELIPEIINTPDWILRGKLERLIFVKFYKYGKKKEPHVVVIETNQKGNIIVTSFVTDEKYLKNFEILWRTGSSQL